MPDKSRPDAIPDDFDRAARINFRDYPGSALVAFAAVTSGLAWLLYKRRGRKDAAQRASPDDVAEPKDSALQVKPQTEESEARTRRRLSAVSNAMSQFEEALGRVEQPRASD